MKRILLFYVNDIPKQLILAALIQNPKFNLFNKGF